jgi:TonB family protein
LFVWVRVLHPGIVTSPEHSFRSVQLVSAPAPMNHRAQPPLPRAVASPEYIARVQPAENALLVPAQQPRATRIEEAVAPTVRIAPKKLDALPMVSMPQIPRIVRTNLFSSGSSAAPTVAAAPSRVQTGGFGDPNGIPAKASEGRPVNVAAAGSFDLPPAGGYGNGSGGAKGTPGVVASTGFGNGAAVGDGRTHASPSRSPSQSTVQTTGFGNVEGPAAPANSHPAEPAAALPAEILSKPTPDYTQEARSLRIQGEVLLDVVLQASGSLHVVRVMRGLGHGLDDNAVKAAEQIRFKPATRNGQPEDSRVVLHIVFQLA